MAREGMMDDCGYSFDVSTAEEMAWSDGFEQGVRDMMEDALSLPKERMFGIDYIRYNDLKEMMEKKANLKYSEILERKGEE